MKSKYHGGCQFMLSKVLWVHLLRILPVLMFAVPAPVRGDFNFITNNGAITIAYYSGTNLEVTIPEMVYGMPVSCVGTGAFFGNSSMISVSVPASVTNIAIWAFSSCQHLRAIAVVPGNLYYSSVSGVLLDKAQSRLIQYPAGLGGTNIVSGITSIGESAFEGCDQVTNVELPTGLTNIGALAFNGSGLATVIVPKTVTSIGFRAFGACTSLQGVYFEGDAPSAPFQVIDGNNATVFYLPGTSGWEATFGGHPTMPWLPQVLSRDGSFGVRANQFGFGIAWARDSAVVVETSISPASSNWIAVSTNSLTNGKSYFNDPQWTRFSNRFYRVRSL